MSKTIEIHNPYLAAVVVIAVIVFAFTWLGLLWGIIATILGCSAYYKGFIKNK